MDHGTPSGQNFVCAEKGSGPGARHLKRHIGPDFTGQPRAADSVGSGCAAIRDFVADRVRVVELGRFLPNRTRAGSSREPPGVGGGWGFGTSLSGKDRQRLGGAGGEVAQHARDGCAPVGDHSATQADDEVAHAGQHGGPWRVRIWQRSSSNVTSRTQCSRFSTLQIFAYFGVYVSMASVRSICRTVA